MDDKTPSSEETGTQPQGPTQPPGPALPPGPTSDERTWATISHLSAFAGYVTLAGFVVGPLVVWLVKKDQLPFVNDQGKEALNFNISLAIYALIGVALAATVIGLVIAIPLWAALVIGQIVFAIVAGINANNGVAYRYPLTLRLVK